MKVTIFIRFVQLGCWLACSIGIIYQIFISRSGDWHYFLLGGTLVQLMGIILQALYDKVNYVWLIMNISILIIFSLMYLESKNLTSSGVFDGPQALILSIVLMNLLYFSGIHFILKDFREEIK